MIFNETENSIFESALEEPEDDSWIDNQKENEDIWVDDSFQSFKSIEPQSTIRTRYNRE